MLRDSITPTIINAGFRNNVIPSEATANLNVRMLPGHSIDELIGQFGKVVSDRRSGSSSPPTRVKMRRLPTSRAHCTKPSSASPRKTFPGPSLFLSFPPGDRFRQPSLHKVQAYGLDPFPLTEGDDARMHGDDERIPIESFRKGVAFLYHVVSDFASPK